MTKTALIIRHIHFEDLGILEEPLQNMGFQIQYIEAPLANFKQLSPKEPDLVVALGAPIGAFDDHRYPFLQDELAYIQQRIESGKPLLGICLGAQLIARLEGVSVLPMPNKVKEIGFAPVRLTPDGQNSPLQALAGVPLLHWHGDQFEIPTRATRLAETTLCPNQAFAIGHNILGLQFHMEADPNKIESWLVGHACELATNTIDCSQLRRDAQRVKEQLPQAGIQAFTAWVQQWDA